MLIPCPIDRGEMDIEAVLPLHSWLDVLRCIMPVKGLVHVGAGIGMSASRYADWNLPVVMLVEANETLHDRLVAAACHHSGWSTHAVLVSNGVENKDFYIASNANESSILAPEQWTKFWRNLQTLEKRSLKSTRLDTLISDSGISLTTMNWAVVDCMPALPVLESAGELLELFDVVIARVVLDPSLSPAYGSSICEIDEFLGSHGYRKLAVEEERQPAIGLVLYARDWKAVHDVACIRQEQVTSELRAFNKSLGMDLDLQSKSHAQETAELMKLRSLHNEQLQRNFAIHEQLEHLTTEYAKEKKATADAGSRIEQLDKACGQATRLAAQRQDQIDTLLKDNEYKIAELAELTASRNQQAKLASERKAKLEELIDTLTREKKAAVDAASRIEQLHNACEEATRLAARHQQRIDTLLQDNERKTFELAELAASLDQHAKLASERKVKLDELVDVAAKEKQATTDYRNSLEQRNKNCAEQARLIAQREEHINQLNQANAKQVINLLRDQQKQIGKFEESLRHRFNKGLENTTRQIESFIGINTYLERGELMPSLHGWPISADFAFYLISLIEANDYDLIVEFGSGASTVLMATALSRHMQRQPSGESVGLAAHTYAPACEGAFQDSHHEMTNEVDAAHQISKLNAREFLPRIVSFEHNRKYFDETMSKLRQRGVAEVVELEHTPLREYMTAEGEAWLYYGCQEKITALEALLAGKRAKVLVLVDGPPGATQKHARYPALPIVLQHLAAHKLDFLLDDYNRQEEQEIVNRWTELLDRRSLGHEKTVLAFEKGACLISVQ